MRTEDKKQPALLDTDRMPFGKWKHERMMDIPPAYLAWLYYEIKKEGVNERNDLVFNYIWNSQDAIAEELREEFP